MRKIRNQIISAVLISVLALGITGCGFNREEESIQMNAVFFDTAVGIKIFGMSDEEILDGCRNICADYEQMLSRTINTSQIARINHAAGAPVTVSDETIELIQRGIEFGELTDGMFDITIAPLSDLWDIKNNPGVVPPQDQIDEALEHVNYKNILVEGNTVTLTDPQAAIDLGGIAKGYVADRLKEYLLDNGVEHAIIDLGGNVLTVGNKPDGSDFRIGIQKPFADRNEIITSIEVADRSVVSSGTYERYFEKDGRIYHHILNPVTGYPFENDLLQVTIISDSSCTGDGLSTACFALGSDKGKELIESMENVQALFVTDDYELHQTGY